MRRIFLGLAVALLASACKHGDEHATGGTPDTPAPTATETANQIGQGTARHAGAYSVDEAADAGRHASRAKERPQVPRRGPAGPNAQGDTPGGVVSDVPTAVAGGTGADDGGDPAVLGGTDVTLDSGPALDDPNPLDASFPPPGSDAGPLAPRL